MAIGIQKTCCISHSLKFSRRHVGYKLGCSSQCRIHGICSGAMYTRVIQSCEYNYDIITDSKCIYVVYRHCAHRYVSVLLSTRELLISNAYLILNNTVNLALKSSDCYNPYKRGVWYDTIATFGGRSHRARWRIVWARYLLLYELTSDQSLANQLTSNPYSWSVVHCWCAFCDNEPI